ncbi:unnamed protein product [Bursaphelenchus okinawaensis]|uniref:BHLH domain-containing protein n=1 Tax=Bursaphelenchus okinawaensis TaxID=465554 RepID=A0A811KXZ8_9BILA|nr:unnamed protein product [Bursaphelenchus okinawaensis]CAG9114065.1 unnamed protein product [Bursaphelenchus okinawaensis]
MITRNRRRRLISAPVSGASYVMSSSPQSSTPSPPTHEDAGGPIRRSSHARLSAKRTSESGTDPKIKRPNAVLVRRSPGAQNQTKTYIITTTNPAETSAFLKQHGLGNYRIRHSTLGSTDSGIAVQASSRSSATNSKKSSPTESKRSSPTLNNTDNLQNSAQDHVRSPTVASPSDHSNNLFGPDSPGSYNNRELDDFIIDEILSLEDEQHFRSKEQRRGGNSQPLPVSVSYSDNLTALSNQPHHLGGGHGVDLHQTNAPVHSQRGLQQNLQANGSSSSASSMHSSGSLSQAQNIHGSSPPICSSSNFRQVVSSSAPSSSFDMEKFVRRSGGAGGSNNPNDADFFRDRRKKDIHNMIERRRRYNINDRIKELGLMLPKSTAEEMKLNKGTILKASCDYIRQLRREKDMILQQAQEKDRLEDSSKLYMQRIRELEKALEKNGINVPPSQVPLEDRSSTGPRQIKQEPYDESALSPSQTPTGGFMSQLQDMQITSPGYHPNMQPQSSPIPNHNGSRPMMVGSLPADQHLSHYNRGFFNSTSSPIATPNASSHANISEYGTPASTWSPMHNNSMQQSLLVNTGHHHQQQQQLIPGSAPSHSNGYPDLIMEDLSMQNRGPLLQGDPMLGGVASSQMSPEIVWDQAGFSPDSINQQQQQGHHNQPPVSMNSMDY